MLKKIILLTATTLFSFSAFAQNNSIFTDEDFGRDEFKAISKDLSAAFLHTTNSGGSSLGSIWGIEAGLVFGGLESKNLQSVAEDVSQQDQDDLKYLPYAGLIAGLALPFGIGGEVSMIPEVDIEDGSFSSLSASVRWSITDMIPLVGSFSPLKIATRVSWGSTDFDYETSLISGSKETADFSVDNFEIGVTAGFNLFLIEPYIGLSAVKADAELNTATDLVIPGIINNRRFSDDRSGTRTVAGVLLKLPLLRFGVEVSNFQGLNRYTGKISFKL